MINDVIHEAADFIEAYPERFDFFHSLIPRSNDQCGCALGWIGYYSGCPGRLVDSVAFQYLGIDKPTDREAANEFYRRMATLVDTEKWVNDAKLCALGLRCYADRYHPKPAAIPAAIRELFAQAETA